MISKQRSEVIDFIRGIAVILVIWQHCWGPLSRIILSFHMPLFFLLSGYLSCKSSKIQNCNFKEYFLLNFKRLIYPYLFAEGIALCISIVFNSDVEYSLAVKNIFFCLNGDYGGLLENRFWFLPCIFVCNIIVYIQYQIQNKLNNSNKIVFGVSVQFCLLCMVLIQVFRCSRFIWTLDIVFMAMIFINLGVLVENIIQEMYIKLTILAKQHPLTCLCVWGGIILVWLYSVKKNDLFFMFINQYGNCLIAVCNAVVGSTIAICFFIKLYDLLNQKRNYIIIKSILWFGKNSITLFPVHLIVLSLVTRLINMNGIDMAPWYINFITVVTISFIITAFINKTEYIIKKRPSMRKTRNT